MKPFKRGDYVRYTSAREYLSTNICCLLSSIGRAMLSAADVLRKEVIANVSHELRSPLFLIRGYAEMVRDITWTDDSQGNENLNLIVSAAG